MVSPLDVKAKELAASLLKCGALGNNVHSPWPQKDLYAAADLITAQAARIAELERALEPFAEIADWDIGDSESDTDIYRPMDPKYAVAGLLKVGNLRDALRALSKEQADG
jgi:hypothetical protein